MTVSLYLAFVAASSILLVAGIVTVSVSART
jgi:hypothetical protein